MKRALGRWWMAVVGVGALGLGAVAGALWIASERRGEPWWVDGARTIHAQASEHDPRRVLWQPPRPVQRADAGSADEYEPRLSADGTVMVFVRGKPGVNADLYESRWKDGAWGDARPIAAINTERDELGPELSSDGRSIYFYSDRAGGFGGYDVWVSRRAAGDDAEGWSEPENLGPSVNTVENEYGVALTPDGTCLFFSSNRTRDGEPASPGGDAWPATVRERRARHDYDLYVCDLPSLSAAPAVQAGQAAPSAARAAGPARPVTQLNTNADEGAPAVSPAGDFLYFASDRPGGAGGHDLFRATLRNGGARIGPAESLGALVNSAANELDPGLSSDGFRLYFSSDRSREPAPASTPDASTPGQTNAAPADAKQASAPPKAYGLWWTGSREVLEEREARPGISFADVWRELWPWLLLLLLGLLMLLSLVRVASDEAWRRRLGQLSLLAKCLLLSLLLHAAIAWMLALWQVGSRLGEFARASSGSVRVALRSGTSGGGASLASQLCSNLARDPGDVPETLASNLKRADADSGELRSERATLDTPEVALNDSSRVRVDARDAEAADARARLADGEPGRIVLVSSSTLPEQLPAMAAVAEAASATPMESRAVNRLTPAAETVEAASPVATVDADAAAIAKERSGVEVAAREASLASGRGEVPVTIAEQVERRIEAASPSMPAAEPLAAERANNLVAPAAASIDRAGASSAGAPQLAVESAEVGIAPAAVRDASRASVASMGIAVGDAAARVAQGALPTAVPAATGVGAMPLATPRAEAASVQAEAPRQAVANAVEAGEVGRAQAALGNQATVTASFSPEARGAGQAGQPVQVASASAGVGASPATVASVSPSSAGSASVRETAASSGRVPTLASASAGTAPEAGIPTQIAEGSSRASVPAPTGSSGSAQAIDPASFGSLTQASVEPVRIDPMQVGAAVVATSGVPTAPPAATAGARTATASAVGARMPQAPMAELSAESDAGSASRGVLPAIGRDTPLAAANAPQNRSAGPQAAQVEPGGRVRQEASRVAIEAAVSPGRNAALLPGAGVPVSGPAGPSATLARADASMGSRLPALDEGSAQAHAGGNGREADLPAAPSSGFASAPRGAPVIAALGARVERTAASIDPAAARSQAASDAVSITAPDVRTSADNGRARGALALDAAPSLGRSPAMAAIDSRLPMEEPEPVAPPQPVETFAQRDPEVREEMLERGGGSERTEKAVSEALVWLSKMQEPNGRWSGRGFVSRCEGCGGEAQIDADVAMTGLSLLCFLGAGHTHMQEGPYQDAVDRGLRWLLARQDSRGDLRRGETMYGQTVATVALCEALAMTRDPRLTVPARRAVDLVVTRATGRGADTSDRDTSVIGWLIMSLQSARRAGIDVPQGPFDSARTWLEGVKSGGEPGAYAYERGGLPSAAMTAEAMFVQQLLGRTREDAAMRASADYLLRTPPRWKDGAPTYYWYYATLALFEHQGEAWNNWNEGLVPELLQSQRQDGPAKGSWDPQDRWSQLGGRIYQTAVCTLSLEVYYRYRPAGVR